MWVSSSIKYYLPQNLTFWKEGKRMRWGKKMNVKRFSWKNVTNHESFLNKTSWIFWKQGYFKTRSTANLSRSDSFSLEQSEIAYMHIQEPNFTPLKHRRERVRGKRDMPRYGGKRYVMLCSRLRTEDILKYITREKKEIIACSIACSLEYLKKCVFEQIFRLKRRNDTLLTFSSFHSFFPFPLLFPIFTESASLIIREIHIFLHTSISLLIKNQMEGNEKWWKISHITFEFTSSFERNSLSFIYFSESLSFHKSVYNNSNN